MKITSLDEKNLVRIEFSLRKKILVPKTQGIYVLTNYAEDILYIGVSKNLQRRMWEHLNSEEKCELTPLGKAYWFFFKSCSEFRPYERGWIHEHQLKEGQLPHFNKREAPC